MKFNNKILSALIALGITASMTMPLYLTGCAKKEAEETTIAADQNDPGKKEKKNNAAEPIRLEDDFYGYVNAENLRQLEIDPKYGMAGSFFDCEVKKEAQLDQAINAIASSSDAFAPGTNEQMIHDYYHQVKDFDVEKSDANEEIESVVKEIFAIKSHSELLAYAGKMIVKYAVDPFFGFSIGDATEKPEEYTMMFEGCGHILGVSFEEIRNGEEARFQLDHQVIDLLRSFGFSDEEAKKRAEDLTRLGIDLSVNYEQSNFSIDQIKMYSDDEMASHLDAGALVQAIGFKNPYGRWCAENGKVFEDFTSKFNDDKYLESFKTWLAMAMVQQYQNYLSSAHDDIDNLLGKNTLSKDEFAKQMVKATLEEELGEVYVEKFYSEETDKKVREMCEQIRQSYREVISNADWLSEEARAGLLRKLENIKFITGLQEKRKVNPEDTKLFGKDAWETTKNFIEAGWKNSIDALSQPRPKQGQSMSPQTVNACYWVDNVVRITVAIVADPFFSADADPNANLGGLGMVIGHEVGHAFDSQGLNWDENGVFNPEWISKEDREALAERAKACIEYYDGYTIMDVYHVDGALTLAENYADLGSMQIITNIAKTKEERQVLFENYARIWSGLESDVYAIMLLKQDVHSPGTVRVNAVLSSCEAFYETYEIKEGDGMYVPEDKRVSRW